MTTDKALEFVQKRNLPYWKLYKGNERVSQCDGEENPSGSPDTALNLFTEELQSRSPGNYKVNVYRNVKGDSGGHKFEFSITQNIPNSMTGHGIVSVEQLREQIRNEMEIKNSLAQLHDKVNAIGEFLYRQYNEDEKDDLSGIQRLADVFKAFRGMSAQPNAFDASAKPLDKGISRGFFS